MEDLINLKDYTKITRLKRKIKIVDFLLYLTGIFFVVCLILKGMK